MELLCGVQGPVARSLVSANRWLRGIKMYRFPWYLTLVSTNHALSNPGQDRKIWLLNVQRHSCKVIQILESRKLLVVETEILGFGIQNSAQEIRKISLTIGIHCSRFHSRGVQNPAPRFQNPRLSWITLHGQVIDYHTLVFLPRLL